MQNGDAGTEEFKSSLILFRNLREAELRSGIEAAASHLEFRAYSWDVKDASVSPKAVVMPGSIPTMIAGNSVTPIDSEHFLPLSIQSGKYRPKGV